MWTQWMMPAVWCTQNPTHVRIFCPVFYSLNITLSRAVETTNVEDTLPESGTEDCATGSSRTRAETEKAVVQKRGEMICVCFA